MIIAGREIKRIVATGCSFAYGHGLTDRTVESWPARLAERLGVECVNLGVQAMGNEHVFNSIVDYFSMNPEHKKDSFVVPSFSSYIRVEFYDPLFYKTFYKNTSNLEKLWPEAWATRPLIGDYLENYLSHVKNPTTTKKYLMNELFYKEFFNEEYYFARYYRTIIALQSVLKSWLIPYVMFDGLNNPHEFYADKKRIQPLKQQIDEKKWVNFGKLCFHSMTGIKKLPCGHPTAEAHDEMAAILYQHIINNYTLEK
jgi:hypothetical protein